MASARPLPGATERSPLLRSSSDRGNNRQYTDTSADAELDEAELTRKAHAEAERIKAQLPLSMVLPSVISLMSCLCISAIDGTLVISLVGPISSSFGASDRIFWLNTAYMLAMCTCSPIYGRTCDILGRKFCLVFAVLMFALGTIMCALAPTMTMLIVARAVQGVGAGGIQPCIGVVLNDLIPLAKRGMFHSVGQAIFSTGNALGGPLGGLFSDKFGWRFAFSIQIPPIIVALTLLTFCLRLPDLPKSPKEIRDSEESAGKPILTRIRQRLDISGAIFLVIAVTTLLLAFTFVTVTELAWTDPSVLAMLATSLATAVIFLYIEAYHAKEPLVPMRLLKKRTLAATWVIFIIVNFTVGVLYYFPLYFQTILEQSAGEVGIHLLPLSLFTTLGSFFAGWYMKKTGRYYYLMFCSASLAAVTPFWLASWSETNRPSPVAQNLVLAPTGFGISLLFTILMVSPLAVVERHEQSQTIGLMYLFRNLGGIIGVSSSGYMIQTLLQSELAKRIKGPDAAKKIDKIRRNIDIVPSLGPADRLATKQSYAVTLRTFEIFMGILTVIVVFLCIFVEERNLNDPTATSAAKDDNVHANQDDAETNVGGSDNEHRHDTQRNQA